MNTMIVKNRHAVLRRLSMLSLCFCMAFGLYACQSNINEAEDMEKSDDVQVVSPSPKSAVEPQPIHNDAPPSVDLEDYESDLRDIAFYDVVGLANGTFAIGVDFTNSGDATYFHYVPPMTERGTPVYFERLYWNKDCTVSVVDGVTHVSIPMRANVLEDYRFILDADIAPENTHRQLINRSFTLLADSDREINEQFADRERKGAVPIGESAKYHGHDSENYTMPEAGQLDEDTIKTLRTAIYGGDQNALLLLYQLNKTGLNSSINTNALQLASQKLTSNEEVRKGLSENPLLKSIVYHKSSKGFPAQEAIRQAAAAVRLYDEWSFRDSDYIESNIDIERILSVPNIQDFGFSGDPPSQNDVWGAYELDFDGDGLNELVYFHAGGTMGNEFWYVYHMDKDGALTSIENGMDMRSINMRQIDGHYFFINWYYDYIDKQSIGLNLFAMTPDGVLWQGTVYREAIGVRVVLSDVFDESIRPLAQSLEGQLFDYYQQYKTYMGTMWEKPIEPEQVVKELFASEGYSSGFCYGLMDIDNDGTDEIIGEYQFYPSSAHLVYYYKLRMLMSGAKHTVDLCSLLGGTSELQQVFPIQYEGKNYFLTMQPFGDSQYIYKLQEIHNDMAYVLAAWAVTLEDQVVVSAAEYEKPDW